MIENGNGLTPREEFQAQQPIPPVKKDFYEEARTDKDDQEPCAWCGVPSIMHEFSSQVVMWPGELEYTTVRWRDCGRIVDHEVSRNDESQKREL